MADNKNLEQQVYDMIGQSTRARAYWALRRSALQAVVN
jgi:hypothetical protein